MSKGGKRNGAGRKATDGVRKGYYRQLPVYLMEHKYVKGNSTRLIIDLLKAHISEKESLKQTPEKK